jgi:branched-chain amino acid transport system permease protein
MRQLFELLINGLTLGSMYALVALGYSMVYGILKLLNFAHGDVLMIGAFVGYFVLQALGGPQAPAIPVALLLPVMFGAAMIACGLLGVAIERVAYRPLRNAPRFAPLIAALGVSFLLQNLALLFFGAEFRSYNTFELSNGDLFARGVDIGTLHISIARIIVVVATAGLLLILLRLVRSSMLGKAMRATAFDREAATMMGIDVDRVIAATFLVGSALAGAAGVMIGLLYNDVYHYLGFAIGLKAFTAAVVGGIGSLTGAVVGGVVIGVSESLAAGYLPQGSTFQDFWVFLLLIVVLLVRPTGLLGRADIRKV